MKVLAQLVCIQSLLFISTLSAAQDHSMHGQHPADDSVHAHHEAHDSNAKLAPQEPTESEAEHIAPDAPQSSLGGISNERMTALMQMDDAAPTWKVLLDRAEWRNFDSQNAAFWDVQAWYGGDYNKVLLKSEGESVGGDTDLRSEVLWDRIVSRWWSLQTGVRHDIAAGPSRTWAAFGVQGLAPYFFDIEAALYVGEQGRSAARFSAEYDLLLTQRLILQSKFELNAYGKSDPDNSIGAGLADTELGLRLRYEIRREFAPYIGIAWTQNYGNTADLLRASGHDVSEFQALAGARVWF